MPGPIAGVRRSYQLVPAGMTLVANDNLPVENIECLATGVPSR